MISTRSWRVARRYALPPLVTGGVLAAVRSRVALVPLGCAAGVLLFFRDPERSVLPDPALVYAPADGVVTDVARGSADWVPIRDAVTISTFLSLHNVHVTRSPTAGGVASRDELDGRLSPALSPASSAHNRQTRFAIDGPRGRVGVVLVAGALARRITAWVDVGEQVRAGTRLGLIHFGSRVDVILPADRYEPLVRRGTRVRAGQTPVARTRVQA